MWSEPVHRDVYIPFGSGLPRSPGLHVSVIIRDLQSSLGMLKKADGWEMNVCADIGFLWEDALSWAYRDRRVYGYHEDDSYIVPGECGDIFRPDEFVVDGIILSPDGIGPDPGGLGGEESFADHEFKCTWRSCTRRPQDDFYWDTSFKAYCHAMGTTVTVVHVMYLMGNYKGSGPQHEVWRLKYEQKEIDKAWGMVLKHKKEMEERGCDHGYK